ncbi:phosphoglycolate phosphatase [Cohaesibacter celericrescens]|jgi:phosphoglycolate phosphatase|uniref:phosphoglycolate phosphatase n=1 Tax=Cohaesibacter celericrescens TaxID=2067669 RepID=UPI003561C761
MSTGPFSCILFDLDGTLVDTAPDLTGALNHVLALNKLAPVSVDHVRDIVGLGARVTIERGFFHYGRTLTDDALDEALEQFLAHYSANICDTSVLYSGVEESVKGFRDAGLKLGVCTNKTEHLSVSLLEQLGLAHCFDTICGSDTVPNRKPHPDHIHAALARAGGDAAASIMIGDSQADVDSAKAAGLPVIAMSYGYTAVPAHALGADVVLDAFSDIPNVLANWKR